MKFDTVKDAAFAWVKEFNAIPQSVIEKLMQIDVDSLYEITPNHVGQRVVIWDDEHNGEEGEIAESLYDNEKDLYRINMGNGDDLILSAHEFDGQPDGFLPMWGTMWSFGDSIDNWWLEECNGMQLMADCGFRIYEQEDFGYVFGIDGCGYDFYESHWIPLYKARGLKWHETEGNA